MTDPLSAYDQSRDFADKSFRSACYAPFVSMYLDQFGHALACCQNSRVPLGKVGEQSLLEIWRGPTAIALRRSLVDYDFSRGCQFCEWQIQGGDVAGVFTRNFEYFSVPLPEPPWPSMIEFSLSNACNLECVMCDGAYSSAIRARRERLTPLPRAYDERFFAEIPEFLERLQRAKFLGGEPFLAAESLRVMNLMIEMGLSIPCHVTTNGTQWNPTVERILDRLPVSLSVSIDGMTKETVESIRVGVDHGTLMQHVERFRDYARSRGSYLGFTYCLMTNNWHEFGDFLLFADDWDVEVVVNTVTRPEGCSLFALPIERLERILEEWERQSATLLSQLGRNQKVWLSELERLRRHREHHERLPFVPGRLSDHFIARELVGFAIGQAPIERAAQTLREWSGNDRVDTLRCDLEDVILEAVATEAGFLELGEPSLVGQKTIDLFARLRRRYGAESQTERLDESPDQVDRTVIFTKPRGEKTWIRSITFPDRDEEGHVIGSTTLASLRPSSTGPNSLGKEPTKPAH